MIGYHDNVKEYIHRQKTARNYLITNEQERQLKKERKDRAYKVLTSVIIWGSIGLATGAIIIKGILSI